MRHARGQLAQHRQAIGRTQGFFAFSRAEVQTSVLDGDRRVRRQAGGQQDLFGRELVRLAGVDVQRPDRPPVPKQRHAQQSAQTFALGQIEQPKPRLLTHVTDGHRLAGLNDPAGDAACDQQRRPGAVIFGPPAHRADLQGALGAVNKHERYQLRPHQFGGLIHDLFENLVEFQGAGHGRGDAGEHLQCARFLANLFIKLLILNDLGRLRGERNQNGFVPRRERPQLDAVHRDHPDGAAVDVQRHGQFAFYVRLDFVIALIGGRVPHAQRPTLRGHPARDAPADFQASAVDLVVLEAGGDFHAQGVIRSVQEHDRSGRGAGDVRGGFEDQAEQVFRIHVRADGAANFAQATGERFVQFAWHCDLLRGHDGDGAPEFRWEHYYL